jgi:hypothetical protein
MHIANRALRSQVDHLQVQVRELEPLRSQVEGLELMVAGLRSEKELLDEEVLTMRGMYYALSDAKAPPRSLSLISFLYRLHGRHPDFLRRPGGT